MDEKEGKEDEQSLFWADQVAGKVAQRDRFHFLDKPAPKQKEFVIKAANSVSGVLHIGRLSDIIRSESVYRALLEQGHKARLIFVFDDMDPLRRIPEGVPKSYEEHIGKPISRIPDFDGCHQSYSSHFIEEYMKVLHKFVTEKLETYSMSEEYRKGSFAPFIKKLLERHADLVQIQNRHRKEPLRSDWCPWAPVCGQCGRLITPRFLGMEDGKVQYECRDYQFEKHTALGCRHRGTSDPAKADGKLFYKGELAAQWAYWKVSCEGWGKEYQVPGSAFWINGEIAERVLNYPMPVPFFYEHIMVDNVKMSASLGNVVYPREWLEVADPELLRFLYNKRLMTTRSFSWKELPNLYEEHDKAAQIYHGEMKLENEKEQRHVKRLYEISSIGKPKVPVRLGYAHAGMLAQVFSSKEDIIKSLKKTGHYQKEAEAGLLSRVEKARAWVTTRAPEEARFALQEKPYTQGLSDKQKKALSMLAEFLGKHGMDENSLSQQIYSICEEVGLEPKEFYKGAYTALLNREKGPRLVTLLIATGEKSARLLKAI